MNSIDDRLSGFGLVGKLSRPVIDWIFSRFGDDDHCFKSYISEKYHTQLPEEFK